MEELLKDSLEKDENLLWSGRPETFETLDTTNKRNFIIKTVVSVVVAAVLMALYIVYALKSGVGIKAFVVVLLVVCAVFGPLNTFTDASKLRKKVLYAVTDKRLLVVRDSIKDVDYVCIIESSFKKDADGHTTLLCGGRAIKAKPTKWRAMTLIGKNSAEDDTGVCDSFAFYALPDDNTLMETIREHLPVIA